LIRVRSKRSVREIVCLGWITSIPSIPYSSI